MAEKAKVIIQFEGENVRVLDEANAKLGTLDKSGKKTGMSLKSAFLPAIGAIVGASAAMSKLVSVASSLQETSSKFNTVFTGNLNAAKVSADELTRSFAMSRREAMQYLSSVQDLLVPMGMNAELATKMSDGVVKLAADLGSFNNLPTQQVMMDIQSALVGNFETMKKYGVVLNETRLKQEAMNAGLWDGKGIMDSNVKAGIAFKLMVEGNKAALGDMARTSDSFANTFKRFMARMSDLAAIMGNVLLPVSTVVFRVLADGVTGIISIIEKWGTVSGAFKDIWGSVMQAIREQFNILLQTISGGGQAIIEFFTGHFKQAIDTAKNAMTNNILGVTENMTTLKDNIQENMSIIRNVIIDSNSATAGSTEENIERQKNAYASLVNTIISSTAASQASAQNYVAHWSDAFRQQANLKKLSVKEQAAADKSLTGMMNNLSSLMQTKSKDAFKVGKAAAIANALVQTYQSAQGAFTSLVSIPYVGPALGIAAAGAAIAAGLARVASIRAQQMPMAQYGGVIPGSAKGTPLIAGENFRPEVIQPLDAGIRGELGLNNGGGNHYHIHFNNSVIMDSKLPQKFVQQIDEGLEKLRLKQKSAYAYGVAGM